MRSRHRYLATQLLGAKLLPPESALRSAIWNTLNVLYGELGVSRIGFWLIAYNRQSKSAIIRCQHDQVRPLRAALATLTSINSTPLFFHVVGTSGTIRKALSLLPNFDARSVIYPRKHR